MFEKLVPTIFSGSDFRASEPGAPSGQSGAVARSVAPKATCATANVIKAATRVERGCMAGSGGFWGEGKTKFADLHGKPLAGHRGDGRGRQPLRFVFSQGAFNRDR